MRKRVKIPKTDQWLLNGKCRKCRKKKYCGTPCKKHMNSLFITIGYGVRRFCEKRK